jgi:hypothetical protein
VAIGGILLIWFNWSALIAWVGGLAMFAFGTFALKLQIEDVREEIKWKKCWNCGVEVLRKAKKCSDCNELQ